MKPRLLDLFCGAGGAAMGYHRAGFEVMGVDIEPQKNYPFKFIKEDAMDFDLTGFDAIHASPPCQAYSLATNVHNKNPKKKEHPDLIQPTRDILKKSGVPYVIENVPGAPLNNYTVLCGSMFEGLRVYRHRLFETHPFVFLPPFCCNHRHKTGKSKGEYHTLEKSEYITCAGHNFSAKSGRIAMDIDWMTRDELAQAIPPAYTKYIGDILIKNITN